MKSCHFQQHQQLFTTGFGEMWKTRMPIFFWWKYINKMCVCSVIQLCLTLCDPMDSSPPGSSVHGIFQARILEWVAISYSREKYKMVQSFLENNLEVSLIVKHIPSIYSGTFSSVHFGCSVMSDSLWPHELQHARPPKGNTCAYKYFTEIFRATLFTIIKSWNNQNGS